MVFLLYIQIKPCSLVVSLSWLKSGSQNQSATGDPTHSNDDGSHHLKTLASPRPAQALTTRRWKRQQRAGRNMTHARTSTKHNGERSDTRARDLIYTSSSSSHIPPQISSDQSQIKPRYCQHSSHLSHTVLQQQCQLRRRPCV